MQHVLEAISIRRKITGGQEAQDNLAALVRRYVSASMFRRPDIVLNDLARELRKQIAREYLPYARAVARQAVKPIVEGLKGRDFPLKDLTLRGRNLARMQRYTKRNLLVLRAELAKEIGLFKGEIEATFARGYRDGQARKQIIDAATEANRAQLEARAKSRLRVQEAETGKAKAERKLARARNKKRARAELKTAKAELRKARSAMRGVKTTAARFETRMQGIVRDGIRREAEAAQRQTFRQLGYERFAWIAVNGDDACPYCEAMHGTVKTDDGWKGQGPGESPEQAEYCGAACMCILVPDDCKKSVGDEPIHKSWVD